MKQSSSFTQVATNLLNVLQGCSKTIRLLLVMFLTLTVTTNAWGETKSITLTQSALGLTGSYTTNTEKTIGGVTFMYSNLMKNNDNIQAQATGGEIYNSTAIPGNIVSVAVTHSGTARSSTISFGTSAKATTESSTFSGTKTIEPTSDYQYFYIKRGSNAAYWTQIVITYETDGDDSGDTNCLTLSATSNYPFNSTSSSNTSVYSTTIDGITFENKGGYKYNSYLSFNRSLSGAYIANTTPFNGNIESIVVDYSSGGSSYFNMYEGSASKPSSTVVSPSKTGTGSVTYTFSGNNPYFKLALKTTGDYCNINSITICYSNTAAPSCTNPTVSWSTEPANGNVGGTMTAKANTNYPAGLTYSSSDPSVATIDASGVIEYLKVGSTTITASVTGDGTTYCNKTVSVSKTITVTCGSKVTINTTSDGNGTITINKTPIETCSDNDGDRQITITLNPNSHYSSNAPTISGITNATITGSGNTYTVQLPKGSNGTLSVSASFKEDDKYTVIWSADDATIDTEQVYVNEKVSVVPTISDIPEENRCGDKFVGWTTEAIPTPQDDAPGYFTTVADSPEITKDITFYAVFADYEQ